MTLFPLDDYLDLAPNRRVHDRLFLGPSGWTYDDWDGSFYPEGTSNRERLNYVARQFRSVEIDSTFYGTPAASTVNGWYERTPDDFMMSAKFPASVSHHGALMQSVREACEFVEVMSELGEKLGPLLLQFPPTYTIAGLSELSRFLESLPSGMMYAVEVRHRSWLVDEFAEVLERNGATIVMSCGGRFEHFWRITSRVAYVRWLGVHDAMDRFDEVQIDRQEEIDWWIPRIRGFLDRGGVLFGYANNHYMGHSPATLRILQERLKSELASPSDS